MKDDYVSFEVAKLLKEKGFNEPIWTRYEDDNEVIFGDKYNWNNSPMGHTSAPTHQMAMKWLREKGIFIQIGVVEHSTITIPEDYYFFKVYRDRRFVSHEKTETYHTYEEACETAIKYCLKHLI